MTRSNDITQIIEKIKGNQLNSTSLADGSGVLLDVENNQVLTFNPTGLVIFEALQSGITQHEEIVQIVTDTFEITPNLATQDINLFIERLNTLLI